MNRRALLQGIFPTQGSNPGLPHCRQILYCLSHQGSQFMLLPLTQMFLDFCCCSVTMLCPTLCDPMGCSAPGFPVLHWVTCNIFCNMSTGLILNADVPGRQQCPVGISVISYIPDIWMGSSDQTFSLSALSLRLGCKYQDQKEAQLLRATQQPGSGRNLGENGHMYMYDWAPSLFTWNYHNIVNQLYPKTK